MPVIGQGDKDKIISVEISIIRNLVLAVLVILKIGLGFRLFSKEIILKTSL